MVAAGTRTASAHGGSIEVTIPARVAHAVRLSAGEEVLVTGTDEAAFIHPEGVPMTAEVETFGGHHTVQAHNGSLKVVISANVVETVGIEAGGELQFQFDPQQSLIRLRRY
jgi:antitoxin component of MazEF toxin-antitoxin module